MIRRRVRVAVTLVSFVVASAGFAPALDFSIGAHGGLSIPNIRGNQTNIFTQGFGSREGPFFGIFVESRFSSHFSLVAELNYTSQGGQRNGLQPITMELPPGLEVPPGTILYGNFHNETILDYIEIPVMARVTFGNRLRFFLNAGPYVGFLVRALAVTRGSSLIYLDEAGTEPVISSPVSFDADTDVKDSLKTTNFGLAGGGGLMYPLGPGDLILEAHFQLGLLTIQKDVETSGKSQTGAVVISLGYSFSLRRSK